MHATVISRKYVMATAMTAEVNDIRQRTIARDRIFSQATSRVRRRANRITLPADVMLGGTSIGIIG
jgi:hypothetical protein